MSRSRFVATLLMLSFSGAALAADPCQQPITPGLSIGRARLGMSLNDLRGVGTVKPLNEKSLALQLADGTQLEVRLDAKQRAERVRIEAPVVCLAGSMRRIDLKAKGADTVAPLPDCGLSAAAHRSSWQCRETGVEFFWEGEKSGASVFKPAAIKPFTTAPPPRPEPPKPVKECEETDGGEKKCVEVTKDPCAGNVAPMPEVACGFFGRNEGLALQCYLTHWCMGVFDSGAAGRIEVRGEDGALLGTMLPWNDGRGLRYAFKTAPRVGSKVRILIDGALSAVPPESSLPNPAVSPAEAQARAAVGAAVPVKVRFVSGARPLPGGFVLDLKVPRSAINKDATGADKPAQ